MALLLNSAGASAADPILKNLGIEWVIAASSMDVATFTDAWIDQSSGFPGTSSVKGSLSPAYTVLTSGNAGSYDDTTKRYTIASTTGLAVGDYIYLSHASLTAGIYKVATIPVAGAITLTSNPLNGSGNKSGISYQVAWRYAGTAGTAPIVSSAGGQINYVKSRVADSQGNVTDSTDTFYVRDAPSGTSFILIDGKDYTGQTTNNTTPTFNLLPSWTNRGGVGFVELANHSVQATNNFRWGDASVTEKSLATALSSGFTFTAGDGVKYGRLLLKSASGATVIFGVDISITLDTAGPTITFALFGR